MSFQIGLFTESALASAPSLAPSPAPKAGDGITRGALLSEDGAYRYTLTRLWAGANEPVRQAVFVMLNPSTADGREDDPTIRRCIGFAKRFGCNALGVVNLYALRATDPAALAKAADPVGPESEEWIRLVVEGAVASGGLVIVAWGASGPKGWEKRAAEVLARLAAIGDVYCLGTTSSGAPRHPLYLKAAAPLQLLAKGPSVDPLALSTPDGTVLGYACRYCLSVVDGGRWGQRVVPSAEDLSHAREQAMDHCRCRECGKVEIGSAHRCKACEAKAAEAMRPRLEAWEKAQESEVTAFAHRLTEVLKTWEPDAPAPYPLTIVHARDGLGFFAFPLEQNEVPEELAARVDGIHWLEANQGAPFGHGPTPELALARLRDKARDVKAAAEEIR